VRWSAPSRPTRPAKPTRRNPAARRPKPHSPGDVPTSRHALVRRSPESTWRVALGRYQFPTAALTGVLGGVLALATSSWVVAAVIAIAVAGLAGLRGRRLVGTLLTVALGTWVAGNAYAAVRVANSGRNAREDRTPAAVGLAFRSVTYGRALPAWYVPGDSARPVIVIVHGY